MNKQYNKCCSRPHGLLTGVHDGSEGKGLRCYIRETQ